MNIEEAARRTLVESTMKSFSRLQEGRSAFHVLIANHNGEVKHRSISKKRLHLFQTIKWNGWGYTLETNVCDHRKCNDDLMQSYSHIQCAEPGLEQLVECLIDIIN